MAERETSPARYADNWDTYVRDIAVRNKAGKADVQWPGDEWGTPEQWDRIFRSLFVERCPPDARLAMEIGPGSGKYTIKFLDHYAGSKVVACDVSGEYLKVLRERCADYITEGRCTPAYFPIEADALLKIGKQHDLLGKLDVLFSIDAMVHVDLHCLFSYWLSAKDLLRPGGKMVMTVSDATTEGAYQKIVRELPLYFQKGRMVSKFEWISPEIVKALLGRLGFEVELVQGLIARDCCFVATKH